MTSRNKFETGLSIAETIGSTACSAALILNAMTEVVAPDFLKYLIAGYSLLEVLVYLGRAILNLARPEEISPEHAVGQGEIVIYIAFGLVGGFGINKNIDTYDFIAILGIIGFFGAFYEVMKSASYTQPLIPKTIFHKFIKNTCQSIAWFMLVNNLTNPVGCFFLAIATMISIKESYSLSSLSFFSRTPANVPVDSVQPDASSQAPLSAIPAA